MTYRIEYNGGDAEEATLDGALDSAKNAIATDVGPVSGWTVEHDEAINNWFVQGVVQGAPVGPTAIVTGPEPIASASPSGRVYSSPDAEDWARFVSFTGATPAEAFGLATRWLAERPEVAGLNDVSWHPSAAGLGLRIYYR